MDSLFKRILAYLIDMFLVTIVISALSSSNIINFQLESRNNNYDKYIKLYNSYNTKIEKCNDLKKAIDNKIITDNKYIDKYKELDKDSADYNSKCELIIKEYNSNKIKEKDYINKINNYYYKIERNSIFNHVISIIIYLLYFVLFQGFTKGQTLGKKIMRLKVVSMNDDDLSYRQLFVRTIFLYSIIYNLLMIISSLVVPLKYFSPVTNVLYLLDYLLSLVIIFTICFVNKRRGIHDIIANTRVKMMDFKGNEIEDKKIFDFSKKNKRKKEV